MMPPFALNQQRQFWFNSQALIAESQLIRILQNRPTKHPRNPILVADQPWEGSLVQLFTAVEYDPATGRWQMWYEGHPAEVLLCTAFSDDGLHWRKPNLSLETWQGSTANNIILQPGYWDAHQPAVVKAPTETDPARRYKLYYWMGPEWFSPSNPVQAAAGNKIKDYTRNGWYVAFSPDGVHWTPQTAAPVLAGRVTSHAAGAGAADFMQDTQMSIGDYNTVIWDEQRGRYRSYHKLDKRRPGWDLARRCMGMAESDDGLHFEPSISILDPDEADDAWARAQGGIRAEFYGLHVWPHQGFYLGLLWMFLVTKTGEPPYGRGWDDGPITPHLVYSPDGIQWQRLPLRESFIPLGPAGSFEAGTIYSGDRPTVVGDEVRFYYHGCSYTHGFTEPVNSPNQYTGIALATLERDRYVGWQGSSAPGTLLTHPVTFTGRTLRLNLDASRGATRVALLDGSGNPLPGYGLDDCHPLTLDSLEQIVYWRGGSDLSALVGQPVQVQFELRLSTLFTWQFV